MARSGASCSESMVRGLAACAQSGHVEGRPNPMSGEASMRRDALEGVHVLDFAWVGVGPITTKYLADNGADVIRVESLARPDVRRRAPPEKAAQPGIDASQFFASYNTSKRGITLDLGKPRARELVLKLLPWG